MKSPTLAPNLVGFWRLCEIHRLVSEGAYPNCRQLAERLGVHRRTIERDIERMKDLFGAPVAYDAARRGYFYTETFTMPPMKLKEGEAIVLFMGQKLLAQCRGTPFEDLVQNAVAKIAMLLPGEIEMDLERAVQSVSFHVEPLRGEEVLVAGRYQAISQAISERKRLMIGYYSAARGTLTTRKVDPYHLRLTEGAWYLIGHCHMRGEARIFALDRITSLEVTEETFPYPQEFSIDDYLADSLVLERGEPRRVVIEFSPEAAPYVRGRRWHSSQIIEELPGGGLKMTLVVGSIGEVTRWVMSYGKNAKVVEPQDLRSSVKRELLRALDGYKEGPPEV